MRQWRVGSFSMALILIFLGIGLIATHFYETTKAFELVITWWPLALILLGAEILVAGFLSRNDQLPLKYDGWSIFLVIILFLFCLGNYTLYYSGVIPEIREAIAISEHSCPVPDLEIDLAGINRVLVSSRGGDLELHSISGNKLTILGLAAIPASTPEAARELAEATGAETRVIRDTLYIRIDPVAGQNNIFRGSSSRSSWALFIPAAATLELDASDYYSSIALNLDSLKAPWSIENRGPVRVNLSPGLDLSLYGSVPRSRENLTGNAGWSYSTGEETAGSAGEIRLGQGRWPLQISSGETIEANIRRIK